MDDFYIFLHHFGPKAAQMLQMIHFGIIFGTILDQFEPKAARMLQMVHFDIFLDQFGPKAAQMLQMVHFGTILGHFGPKAARMPEKCQNRLSATARGMQISFKRHCTAGGPGPNSRNEFTNRTQAPRAVGMCARPSKLTSSGA